MQKMDWDGFFLWIGKLEFLDEVEELNLFLDHYFLLTASNKELVELGKDGDTGTPPAGTTNTTGS